jgi:hypothetical membrane protein
MRRRQLFLFGAIAPWVYLFTVILGGAMRPEYSHMAHAVSELTEAGAPNKVLLDALFSVYNILLVIFAATLLSYVRERPKARKQGVLGAWVLIAVGVMGLLTNLFFPMDPRGAPTTLAGTIHLVLAGLLSLGTILATLLIGRWLYRQQDLRGYGTYSLITCAVIFLSGGFAAAMAATVSPIMGLAARITIGAFLQWLVVIALKLFSVAGSNPIAYEGAPRE